MTSKWNPVASRGLGPNGRTHYETGARRESQLGPDALRDANALAIAFKIARRAERQPQKAATDVLSASHHHGRRAMEHADVANAITA